MLQVYVVNFLFPFELDLNEEIVKIVFKKKVHAWVQNNVVFAIP